MSNDHGVVTAIQSQESQGRARSRPALGVIDAQISGYATTGATAPARKVSPDDTILATRCLAGDATAWREMINRYQRLIYSVIRLHFRDSDAADDVFQDVCTELFRHLATIKDCQALPAWLMTVARRKCHLARMRSSDWSDIDTDTLIDIDNQLGGLEGRFWIEQAMKHLSDRERALIEALYLDDEQPSYAEIATRLNMPVASIGPTRARCLEKLRKHWEGA